MERSTKRIRRSLSQEEMNFFTHNRTVNAARKAEGNTGRLEGTGNGDAYAGEATDRALADIKPGMGFYREGRNAICVHEYIRHYNRFFDVRRFQSIPSHDPPDMVEYTVIFPGMTGSKKVLTRTGAFIDRLAHTSWYCFDDNDLENNDPLIDIPFYRDDADRYHVDQVLPLVRRMVAGNNVNDANAYKYKNWKDVPLDMFNSYNLDRRFYNCNRWGRDHEMEQRVRNLHGHHLGGHNTEFWTMEKKVRFEVYARVIEAEKEIYKMNRILNVGTPDVYHYFTGHLVSVIRASHTLQLGSNYNGVKQQAITEQLSAIAAAHIVNMGFGCFAMRALYGADFGFNDSGLTAAWGRFVGVLVPVNDAIRELVEKHGIAKLLEGSGLPVDQVWMAWERTNRVDWDAVEKQGEFPFDVYLRYDPKTGDIDDLLDRPGGDKLLSKTLPGARVVFRGNVETVDDLQAMDYYRYETIRLHGENAVVNTFPMSDTNRSSFLEDKSLSWNDGAVQNACEMRDYPFGRDESWYRNRRRGIGLMSRPIGVMVTTASEVDRPLGYGMEPVRVGGPRPVPAQVHYQRSELMEHLPPSDEEDAMEDVPVFQVAKPTNAPPTLEDVLGNCRAALIRSDYYQDKAVAESESRRLIADGDSLIRFIQHIGTEASTANKSATAAAELKKVVDQVKTITAERDQARASAATLQLARDAAVKASAATNTLLKKARAQLSKAKESNEETRLACKDAVAERDGLGATIKELRAGQKKLEEERDSLREKYDALEEHAQKARAAGREAVARYKAMVTERDALIVERDQARENRDVLALDLANARGQVRSAEKARNDAQTGLADYERNASRARKRASSAVAEARVAIDKAVQGLQNARGELSEERVSQGFVMNKRRKLVKSKSKTKRPPAKSSKASEQGDGDEEEGDKEDEEEDDGDIIMV